MRLVQLLEADVLGVLMEALPAEVEVVLPDQAVPIAASFTLPRAGSKLPWSGIPDVVMTHFNSTDHSLL